ncbi:hypothetical protein [Desulfobacter sp.]
MIGILIGLEIPVIIRINNDFSKELSTNLGNIPLLVIMARIFYFAVP